MGTSNDIYLSTHSRSKPIPPGPGYGTYRVRVLNSSSFIHARRTYFKDDIRQHLVTNNHGEPHVLIGNARRNFETKTQISCQPTNNFTNTFQPLFLCQCEQLQQVPPWLRQHHPPQAHTNAQ